MSHRKGRSRKRAKASPGRPRPASRKAGRWSQRVTNESNALDLEAGVFTLDDPKAIASSLRRSALQSRRRKASAYRSALSMLTFYINRAGRTLPATRRRTLEAAKTELRSLFGEGEK